MISHNAARRQGSVEHQFHQHRRVPAGGDSFDFRTLINRRRPLAKRLFCGKTISA